MNKYFKDAEKSVNTSISNLSRLMPHDGEDIACYNPAALDETIASLIQARSNMAIGRMIDEAKAMKIKREQVKAAKIIGRIPE